MELRDYIRMLKRGWPVIVLVTGLVLCLSALYTTVAPKRYEAQTVLFVSGQDAKNTGDLQEGNAFALSAVVTYGKIIMSAAVLGPAGASLQPPRPVEDLGAVVTAQVPEETTLIVVTAAASEPDQAAVLANTVAATSMQMIPRLQLDILGRPLVQMVQLRPAVAPKVPVSPNTKRTLALGLVVGLCLGLALTISAQTLDTRIRRADDVRTLTDVPLLAEIRHRKRRGHQNAVAVRDEPTGATGEAFRTLRTNLGFMEPRTQRSLVFAAVAEDKNGAQVPVNLAWSLAQAGWSVLLVDLDLRHSTVADTIGMQPGRGLADVLLGKRNLPEVVQDTVEPHLRVVASGTPQSSPSDLLSGPAMNNLLRRMEQEHDYVILHAPPLLSYTDAALVSRAVGGSFVTVAAGHTRAQELTTALTALANVRIKPAGLVLTGTRRFEGLAGLRGSGAWKQTSGAGAQVSAGLPQLKTDSGLAAPSISANSPAQSTLRMMPPAAWSGGRPPESAPPTRPRPALRPLQPAQPPLSTVQPSAVQPSVVRPGSAASAVSWQTREESTPAAPNPMGFPVFAGSTVAEPTFGHEVSHHDETTHGGEPALDEPGVDEESSVEESTDAERNDAAPEAVLPDDGAPDDAAPDDAAPDDAAPDDAAPDDAAPDDAPIEDTVPQDAAADEKAGALTPQGATSNGNNGSYAHDTAHDPASDVVGPGRPA